MKTYGKDDNMISENSKVTLTLGQLKKLVNESDPNTLKMPWDYVSNLNTLTAIDETLGEVIDILNDWHGEMDHALYSQLWDRVDQALAWVKELKEAAQKEGVWCLIWKSCFQTWSSSTAEELKAKEDTFSIGDQVKVVDNSLRSFSPKVSGFHCSVAWKPL